MAIDEPAADRTSASFRPAAATPTPDRPMEHCVGLLLRDRSASLPNLAQHLSSMETWRLRQFSGRAALGPLCYRTCKSMQEHWIVRSTDASSFDDKEYIQDHVYVNMRGCGSTRAHEDGDVPVGKRNLADDDSGITNPANDKSDSLALATVATKASRQSCSAAHSASCASRARGRSGPDVARCRMACSPYRHG